VTLGGGGGGSHGKLFITSSGESRGLSTQMVTSGCGSNRGWKSAALLESLCSRGLLGSFSSSTSVVYSSLSRWTRTWTSVDSLCKFDSEGPFGTSGEGWVTKMLTSVDEVERPSGISMLRLNRSAL
jgi:hypothetical protein